MAFASPSPLKDLKRNSNLNDRTQVSPRKSVSPKVFEKRSNQSHDFSSEYKHKVGIRTSTPHGIKGANAASPSTPYMKLQKEKIKELGDKYGHHFGHSPRSNKSPQVIEKAVPKSPLSQRYKTLEVQVKDPLKKYGYYPLGPKPSTSPIIAKRTLPKVEDSPLNAWQESSAKKIEELEEKYGHHFAPSPKLKKSPKSSKHSEVIQEEIPLNAWQMATVGLERLLGMSLRVTSTKQDVEIQSGHSAPTLFVNLPPPPPVVQTNYHVIVQKEAPVLEDGNHAGFSKQLHDPPSQERPITWRSCTEKPNSIRTSVDKWAGQNSAFTSPVPSFESQRSRSAVRHASMHQDGIRFLHSGPAPPYGRHSFSLDRYDAGNRNRVLQLLPHLGLGDGSRSESRSPTRRSHHDVRASMFDFSKLVTPISRTDFRIEVLENEANLVQQHILNSTLPVMPTTKKSNVKIRRRSRSC